MRAKVGQFSIGVDTDDLAAHLGLVGEHIFHPRRG